MTNYRSNLSFIKILKIRNQIHDIYAFYPLITKVQPITPLYDQYITKNNPPDGKLRMCTVPLDTQSQYNQPYNKRTIYMAGTYVHAPFSTVPPHNPTQYNQPYDKKRSSHNFTQLFWSHCYI